MADEAQARVVMQLVLETKEAERQLGTIEKSRDDMTLKMDADTSAAQAAVDALAVPPEVLRIDADTSVALAAVGDLSAEAQRSAAQTERAVSQVERPLTRQGSLLTRLRGWFAQLTDRVRQFGTQGLRSGEQVNRSFSVLGGTGRALLQTLTSLFAVTRVIAWGRACVSASTEAENAFRGLSSILAGQGRDFAAAQGWLQDYVADGLVPLSNAVTSYKNLAARGYDDTQIRAVMTALKDSAAYGRQASYTLGDAVMSATEGLKNENSILVDNAGVTKNVAKMWDDYARSVGTSANQLTTQQKIQAEVNGILNETRFQTGDAARVAGTFSGQVSQLAANLNTLKTVVGDYLKAAGTPLIGWLNRGTHAAAVFLRTIADALGISADVSGTQSLASGMSQAAENTDDLTASLQTAKKAQDALKAASFDDFNVIGTPQEEAQTTAPDTTPASGAGAYLSDAEEMTDSMDALTQKAQGFAAMWLDGWDMIRDAWGKAGEKWSAFKDNWIDGAEIIRDKWDGFKDNWLTGAGVIRDGWDGFKDNWVSGAELIGEKWDGFKDNWLTGAGVIRDGWNGFKDNWITGAGVLSEVWSGFQKGWTAGAGMIRDKFSDLKNNWVTGTQTIREKWNGFRDNWITGAGTIRDKFGELRDNWNTGVQDIGDRWDRFWTDKGVRIVNFVSGMKDNWKTGLGAIRTGWASGMQDLGDKWAGFRDNWKTGFSILRDNWNAGFDALRDKAGEKWTEVSDRIKAPFDRIGDWFHDKFALAWERVKGVFSGGGPVFEGIRSGIDDTFRQTVNGLIDGLNNTLSLPFWNLSESLRVIREWSIWLPWAGDWQPFGGLPSIEIPQIPRLAHGGLVSQPTLAMVGDNPNAQNDPEVVSPLSKLRSLLPEQNDGGQIAMKLDSLIRLLQMILSVMQEMDPAGHGLSDKEIYAAAERGRRRYQKMKGVI